MDQFQKRQIKVNVAIFLVLLSCSQKEKEKGYYPDNSLKYEVPILEGRRNGRMTEFFENGNVKSFSTWENDRRNGESIIFNVDGSLFQKNNYRNGIRCCISEFYSATGDLVEKQFINANGRMMDFIKYAANGKQDSNLHSKKAVVISNKDTLDFGEVYNAKIRLGNRQSPKIKILLGEYHLQDDWILTKEPLPMIDSITALLSVKASSIGKNQLSGVILEFKESKSDSILVIPFEVLFFVKPSKRL